jgi:uncharacterized protein PF11_0207
VEELMSNVEVTNLLERLKKINKEVEQVNQKAVQSRGFKNAQIELIKADEKKLAAMGIELNLDIDEKGNIPKERIANFVEIFNQECKAKVQQAARTEKLVEAVKNDDYETIKALTGEDLREETYELDIASVKELIAKEEEELEVVKENITKQHEEGTLLGGAVVEDEVKPVVDEDVEPVKEELVNEEETETDEIGGFSFEGLNFSNDEEVEEEIKEEPKEEVKKEVKDSKPTFSRRTTRVVQEVEDSQEDEDDIFGSFGDMSWGAEDEQEKENKTTTTVDFNFEASDVEDNELSDKGNTVNMFFSGMNTTK